MRVFVAGGSGAIGRRLVPQLIEHGHEVVATTRNPDRSDRLRALGVDAARDGRPRRRFGGRGRRARRAGGDRAPDDGARRRGQPEALRGRVRAHEPAAHARPDYLLTRPRRRRAAASSRRATPAGRTTARARPGARRSTIRSTRTRRQRSADSLAAIRYLERAVARRARSRARAALRQPLRPGHVDGRRVRRLIRKRKLPLVGDGAGVWSFIHVDDAAAATVAAVEGGAAGVYNIVDDDPAPVVRVAARISPRIGAPGRRGTCRCGSRGSPSARSASR